jgi:succinate dehydrogenase / fumarate reductase flavoprotein subunit
MAFAREADGRISQRFFGAHTFRRTAFAGDYTGLEIQRTLVNRVRQLDVPIIDTMYVTRILTRNGVVFGAYGFDIGDGTRYVIHAHAVILAADGHTRIWRRTSSRRDENTVDSFRLALTAQKVVVSLVDDLTGSQADETVSCRISVRHLNRPKR